MLLLSTLDHFDNNIYSNSFTEKMVQTAQTCIQISSMYFFFDEKDQKKQNNCTRLFKQSGFIY